VKPALRGPYTRLFLPAPAARPAGKNACTRRPGGVSGGFRPRAGRPPGEKRACEALFGKEGSRTMTAANYTVKEVLRISRKYLSEERLRCFLEELLLVEGNVSFKQTIKMLYKELM
jgi:hypothetical protein